MISIAVPVHGKFTFTTTLTSGISCLNHELFDDSMKYVTIVIAVAGMHTEVLHCLRAAAYTHNMMNIAL